MNQLKIKIIIESSFFNGRLVKILNKLCTEDKKIVIEDNYNRNILSIPNIIELKKQYSNKIELRHLISDVTPENFYN